MEDIHVDAVSIFEMAHVKLEYLSVITTTYWFSCAVIGSGSKIFMAA